MLAWAAYGALWELGHPVTFDGENKLIYVDPSVTEINFGRDVYSNWKEWVQLYDNSKWDAALRTTGGDPLGDGQYVGQYFFFINNWRMVIDHDLTINGNVFADGYPTPYVAVGGTQLVLSKVSSLATQIEVPTGGGGSSSVYISDTPPTSATAGDLWWNSSTGLMMIYYFDGNSNQWVVANPTGGGGGDCPTAEEIRLEMESSGNMLSNIFTQTSNIEIIVTDIQNTLATSFPTLGNIADAVWEAALASYVTSGSAGFIVSTILTQVTDINDDTNHIRPIIDNIELLAEEILKYDRNRTRIDKAAKTLTVYDDDEVTPIRVFNLLDGTGTPSVAEVLERDPI